MSEHTPGPWAKAVHNWSQISVCTKDRTVCRLDITDEATEETENDLVIENEANARLIAAAPQMLEALEAIIKRFQPEQHDAAGCMFKNCELCKAIAVVKAAKGEV